LLFLRKAFAGVPVGNSIIARLLLQMGGIFLVTILVIGYLWVSAEFQRVEEDNRRYKAEYLENQKASLRAEVQRVKALLLREKAKAVEELESRLKEETQHAFLIAQSIYESNKGVHPDAVIQQMIVSALRDIRLNGGRSYYFISTTDRVQVLYPPIPAFEGRPLQDVYSDEGMQVAEQMLELVLSQGEGFIRYDWQRPGTSELQKKYSYVTLFAPYGWIIGTGDYLAAYEEGVKQRIFRQISEVTYGVKDEGYFFINGYKGDLYVTNGQYFGGSKNIWEVTDARGSKVVQENARLAQTHPEGAFSRYVWKKNNGQEAEKISYVLGIDDWGVFIGTGAYVDTLEAEIARREAEHRAQVKQRIISALAVLGLAAVIVIVLMVALARKLSGNIRLFQSSFERAVDTRAPIDPQTIHFAEFKGLAASANQMIDGLNEQAEELRHHARHDYLTSLPNRMHGANHLSQMIDYALEHDVMGALLFIDLDHFKEINDSLGHSAGDELLQQVSRRLGAVVREGDIIARLGGDEFTIITGMLHGPEDAAAIAQKLLAALDQPFSMSGTELHITASIGISLFPNDGSDAEILLRNADSAMYEAKRDGRNSFRFYAPEMTEEVFHRFQMVDELREAIEKNQFELHFQPQICISTGDVIGAEALVRWRHPERGMIPPGEFIPYAETSGQISQIGEWVLSEACTRVAAWKAAGLHIPKVAVNISNRQLRRKSLVTLVQHALTLTGCDPSWLELEITESTLMSNPQEMAIQLEELKRLGISLAIDDFGTGYSSLSYIKQLPINKLKIDRSFIRDLHEDENDRAITRAIIAMGRSLNLTVIAEGAEFASQIAFLAAESCEQVQGFYYSKPLPEAEFVAYVLQHKPRREELQEWL
jgi:diguanylate cyclase (GGDEF)-like protein